jgi:protein TonB
MHALSLDNPHINTRAVGGSVVLHALVVGLLVWSGMSVSQMPPEVVHITLVAPPAAEAAPRPTQRVVKPVPRATPQPPTPPTPTSTQATIKHTPLPQPKAAPEASAEPAESKPAATATSAQKTKGKPATSTVLTKPSFDADYLQNPAPEYPAHAKRRRMQGTVMLDVAVSVNGAARSVRIAQSSGHAPLDSAASDAVKRWKFVPAKRGNTPVAARVMVPIEFRLD